MPDLLIKLTLVNFIATEQGLEEQLLSLVVKKERSDLEEKRTKIIVEVIIYNIRLSPPKKN